MIDWKQFIYGEFVTLILRGDKEVKGCFEGVERIGEASFPFVILKPDQNRTIFVPQMLVERIILVQEEN
jgi:hypothetical protein